jgi:hypothetical protein
VFDREAGNSLADFAKLVELFDQHCVSFVSVTQSFNTTTSMGRLTLNVLLSFAQFEREVIGERVRDKIAASKRKGIWVGGPIPLGYASVGKKLVVVPAEAETVRAMFRLYLERGSIGALAEELGRRNIVSKVRTFASGRSMGGGRYGVGALAHFLKNRFYVGVVVYGGDIHAGEHERILDRATFDAVQARLPENARERHVRVAESPAILMGRIFDDRGNRMTPSHSNKAGVRYRYYMCPTPFCNATRMRPAASRGYRQLRSRRSWSRRCARNYSRQRRPGVIVTFPIARSLADSSNASSSLRIRSKSDCGSRAQVAPPSGICRLRDLTCLTEVRKPHPPRALSSPCRGLHQHAHQ